MPSSASAAPSAHASIIGGDVAAIADFPSLAFIAARTSKDQGFSCTGTVIAPRVILTAAHCVEDLHFGGFTAAPDYKVATGRANPRQDQAGEVLEVSDTHVFPGFDPGHHPRRRRPADPRQPHHRAADPAGGRRRRRRSTRAERRCSWPAGA